MDWEEIDPKLFQDELLLPPEHSAPPTEGVAPGPPSPGLEVELDARPEARAVNEPLSFTVPGKGPFYGSLLFGSAYY